MCIKQKFKSANWQLSNTATVIILTLLKIIFLWTILNPSDPMILFDQSDVPLLSRLRPHCYYRYLFLRNNERNLTRLLWSLPDVTCRYSRTGHLLEIAFLFVPMTTRRFESSESLWAWISGRDSSCSSSGSGMRDGCFFFLVCFWSSFTAQIQIFEWK